MSEEQRNQPGEDAADAARRAGETAAEEQSGSVPAADRAEPVGGEPGQAAPATEPVTEPVTQPVTQPVTEPASVGEAARARAAALAAAATTAGRDKPVVGSSVKAGVSRAHSTESHDVVGEGSPRYADTADEIPPHGSEDSWSATPHPGYVADPKLGYTTKRLAAGTLIGCLVLALAGFFGYKLLTVKSSNGFGSAPWTAAVEQGGAVVGGINAQNNGAAPAVVLPASVSFGTGGANAIVGVQRAINACQYATANTGHLTTSIGVFGPTATLRDWAAQATPAITSLRADAAALRTAVASRDPGTVAGAAEALCASFARAGNLPSIPDATASQDWSAGITAYAQAASSALKGVSGDPGELQTATDYLQQGDVHLETLIVRVTEPA